MHLTDARSFLGASLRAGQRRQQHCRQNRDDPDHNQEFDQGEMTIAFGIQRNTQKTRFYGGQYHGDDYDEISSWFPSFRGNANLLCRGWLFED